MGMERSVDRVTREQGWHVGLLEVWELEEMEGPEGLEEPEGVEGPEGVDRVLEQVRSIRSIRSARESAGVCGNRPEWLGNGMVPNSIPPLRLSP